MKKHFLRSSFAVCLLALLCLFAAPQASYAASAASTSSPDAAIPASQLLQPAELAAILRSSSGEKPLVLQTGSHVLFAEAHIPGAEYAGAGAEDSGLQALRDRVKGLKRNQFIVIYCGCCPWHMCPNIRPAYWQLQSLGFTHVKVLYLADNFGANWADKGYPVAKGR